MIDDDTAGRAAEGTQPAPGDPVVDRALGVLGVFSAERRALSLSDIARISGVPTSTAHRLIGRLTAWGALERRADGRYVIGLRLLEVASLAPRGHGLRELALPYMTDLAEATHQHVLLAVLDNDEGLLVERLSHRTAAPIHYRVGGRLPLHSTGVGLVLLAHADRALQDDVLGRRLVHEPEREPVDTAHLRRLLAQTRREGVAEWHRRSPSPVLSVAAPVWDATDQCLAAVSVVVPDGSSSTRSLVPAVRATARAISRALGAPRAVARPASVVP